MPTCGVVYVHSTPLAVCQHVEWAIARVLTAPVNLHWTAQPVDPALAASWKFVQETMPGVPYELLKGACGDDEPGGVALRDGREQHPVGLWPVENHRQLALHPPAAGSPRRHDREGPGRQLPR